LQGFGGAALALVSDDAQASAREAACIHDLVGALAATLLFAVCLPADLHFVAWLFIFSHLTLLQLTVKL